MEFDVTVTRSVVLTRVVLKGHTPIGRLLSLLQVLALDSRTWPAEAVLFDLRRFESRYSEEEQLRLAFETGLVLRHVKRIAFLAPAGRVREAGGVRAFDNELDAVRWLAPP